MLRRLLPVILLSACTVASEAPVPDTGTGFRITRSAQEAVDAYVRVAARVEPVAERACREKNPSAPSVYCDFRILVDGRTDQPPNAYQTIGKDGRPVLAFNIPMIATIQNDDEIAFILGHEAGHQIRNHLVKANVSSNLAATILGSIFAATGGTAAEVQQAQRIGGTLGARVYSKQHELEADETGTYIAHLAGYDPLVGARSFARFSGGGSVLSTHPGAGQRMKTVSRAMARINALRAQGQPVTVP